MGIAEKIAEQYIPAEAAFVQVYSQYSEERKVYEVTAFYRLTPLSEKRRVDIEFAPVVLRSNNVKATEVVQFA